MSLSVENGVFKPLKPERSILGELQSPLCLEMCDISSIPHAWGDNLCKNDNNIMEWFSDIWHLCSYFLKLFK